MATVRVLTLPAPRIRRRPTRAHLTPAEKRDPPVLKHGHPVVPDRIVFTSSGFSVGLQGTKCIRHNELSTAASRSGAGLILMWRGFGSTSKRTIAGGGHKPKRKR